MDKGKNFIEQIIDEDLKNGFNSSKLQFRFPPRTQLKDVNSESEARVLLKKDIYIEKIENSDNASNCV